MVAVVGVVGTLVSGTLAHRGALRSKRLELDHLLRERREERGAVERRENLEARRASYVVLNQSLRQLHGALWSWMRDLEAGRGGDGPPPEVTEADHAVRDAYAEAQMVASDEVLAAASDVWWLMRSAREQAGAAEKIRELLERASGGLYTARQTMRHDLGITALPVERPEGYGQAADAAAGSS